MSQQSSNLTRRRLLQVGGLGMLGLSLPDFLHASAPQTGSRPQREKSCILIVQGGGPSQIDTWDMKPAAPSDYRGPYKSIPTAVTGFQICELMPRLARLADRYCIIRSMTHTNADHPEAMHSFLAGHASPAADAPYFGAVMAKLQPSTRDVPSYVWLQDLEGSSGVGKRYLTGGFLGTAYAPLRVGRAPITHRTPSSRSAPSTAPRMSRCNASATAGTCWIALTPLPLPSARPLPAVESRACVKKPSP